MNREVRRKMRPAKEEWIEEQCKNTDGNDSGNTKEAYTTLKAVTKTQTA